MKIAFFDTKPYEREAFDAAIAAWPGMEIVYFENRLTAETVSLVAGCDAVCPFVNDRLDEPVLEAIAANGIRLIALRSAGYNHVHLETAYRLRLTVVRVPEYSPHAIAEHTLGMLLCLNRKLHRAYQRTRDGNFSLNGLVGVDLYGRTAGVVGTGRIGRTAAEIFRAIGMRVFATDPFPDDAWAARHGVEYTTLERLCEESYVVSLHCPLTDGTHHMMNKTSLARMRDGAILINTGRGGLVDAHALITELKSGRLGGAALDVYEEESEYFFEDCSNRIMSDDTLARLLMFPNVLITSHQAFLTHEALNAIARITLGNIDDFFAGKPLPNQICYRCPCEPCHRKESGRCF